jgi:hypothetical protein
VIECDSFPGTKPAAGIASGASFGDSDFSFHGASPFSVPDIIYQEK